MHRASAAFLRTRRHPAAGDLGEAQSFDHLYEHAASFEELYTQIVEELVSAARRCSQGASIRDVRGAPEWSGGVVYAVPGSPVIAERSVELLRADPRVDVHLVPAPSFADLAWERLGVDPFARGARLVDATQFAIVAAGERGPLLVGQCWSRTILSEVKLSSDTESGPLPEVTLLHHLGLSDERVVRVPWDEMDRVLEPDHLTSLWIPQLDASVSRELTELASLSELVRILRARCPWDREQTHASLTRHLLEESYEVIDAVAALGDESRDGSTASGLDPRAEPATRHLREELGDLLFQVYFHALLGAEEGRFDLAEVARGVHDKLVARHPHVFGDKEAADAEAVVRNWEVIKQGEKGRQSVTDGIPATLPALALATKLRRKAEALGLRTAPYAELRERLASRLAELPEHPGPLVPAAATELEEALGTALLDLAELARRLGVEPEEALRHAALRLREEIRSAEDAT